MADLEELAATAQKKVVKPKDEEEFVSTDEDYIHQDILDALSMLTQCKRIFDFVGDPDLCRGITKREREMMGRMSEKLEKFLTETTGYGEEDSEEEETET